MMQHAEREAGKVLRVKNGFKGGAKKSESKGGRSLRGLTFIQKGFSLHQLRKRLVVQGQKQS